MHAEASGVSGKAEGIGRELTSERKRVNNKYDRTVPATEAEKVSAIRKIFNIAKQVKDRVERAVIGGITKRQAEDFKKIGLEIDDAWVHSIENSAITHNQNHHGNAEKEDKRGQIAITEEDYAKIPDILENYDKVSVSPNKTGSGNDVIVYTKEYNDGYVYYLEEKRDNRKSLAFQTMYKKKKGADSSDGLLPNATPFTSKTTSDNLSDLSGDKGSEKSGDVQIKEGSEAQSTERAAAKEEPTESRIDEARMKMITEGVRVALQAGKKQYDYKTTEEEAARKKDYEEAVARMDSAFDSLSDDELMSLLKEDPGLRERFNFGGGLRISRTGNRIFEIETRERNNAHYEGAKPLTEPVEGTEKREAKLTDFVSKDESRPVLAGIHHDGELGMAVATDTHVLIADKSEYDASKSGKTIDSKGNEIEGKYPRAARVIPSRDGMTVSRLTPVKVSRVANALRSKMKGMSAREAEETQVAIRFDNGYIGTYSLGNITKFFEGMLKLGNTGVEYFGVERPLCSRESNGAVVIMPVEPKEVKYRLDLSNHGRQAFSIGESNRRGERGEASEVMGGFLDNAGIPVETVNDNQAKKIFPSRGKEGRSIKGWTKDGKIFLNADAMDSETPLHEYTHIWDEMVRRENPELWNRGKELLKETPLWDEVREDPEYADIRDDEDAVASEVHSRLTGKEGSRIMEDMIKRARKEGSVAEAKAVSLVGRLKKWLGEMFESLKKTLGKWSKKDLKNLTLEEFNQMTIRDFAEGLNPDVEIRRGEKARTVVRNNPMRDDYHTGIRGREDVKTFDEILSEAERMNAEEGGLTYPDISIEQLRDSARTGKIKVYSSKPIENGVFVTPSRMNAEDYAGGGKIYERELGIDEIAWIGEDEGQVSLGSDGGRADGKIRFSFSENRDEFDRRREEAVAAKGLVMPGLSEKEVEVVKVPRHNFEGTGKEALQKATQWAQKNIVGLHKLHDSNGKEISYLISKNAIDKYTSPSSTKKSTNLGVHISVLSQLPKIIANSVEAELHPDYKKNEEGLRNIENGHNFDNLIHRFYGAVECEGNDYRVKTTIIEKKGERNRAHNYEVSKIEVLDSKEPSTMASMGYESTHGIANLGNNSEVRKISGKELLAGVEKSYDPGVKLLDASGDVTGVVGEPDMDYFKGKTVVQKSLFDWEDNDTFDKPATRNRETSDDKAAAQNGDETLSESERELTKAGEAADRSIDEFMQSFVEYHDEIRSLEDDLESTYADVEKEIHDRYKDLIRVEKDEEEKEALEEAYAKELDELDAQKAAELESMKEPIEERLIEARDRLAANLEEFYSLNNTAEDARRIARDKANRVLAEMEMRAEAKSETRTYSPSTGTLTSQAGSATVDSGLLPEHKNAKADAELPTEGREGEQATTGLIKTAGGLIGYTAVGHLPDAKEGEFAKAERKFTTTGEFSFTGGDKIHDRGDVAWAMRALEDYAIENTFAVYVRGDGSYKILHIGMGQPNASMADLSAVRAGYDAFGAEKVWFVHNHPSGNLKQSPADDKVLNGIKGMFKDLGVEVEGLIVDTNSGRYSTFDGTGRLAEQHERPTAGRTEDVEAYHMNRLDRTGSGVPVGDSFLIKGAQSVADVVRDTRFKSDKKVNYLVLDQKLEVVGNFHTEYGSAYDEGFAEEMVSTAIKFGGNSVIVYGKDIIEGDAITEVPARLRDQVMKLSGESVRLLDSVNINSVGYESAQEKSLLEPTPKYGEDELEAINNTFNENLQKQIEGNLPSGFQYELGYPSIELQSAGFPILPIRMRSSLLSYKSTMNRHPFELSELRDLVKALQNPVAVFEYTKDNIRNLIIDLTHGDRHFLVGVTLNYKAGDIEINSVSGLFPKDNASWLKWIQDNKGIAIWQKEKVLTIIDSLRTNPADAERIGLNLDSVAKIVENFENPKLEEGDSRKYREEDSQTPFATQEPDMREDAEAKEARVRELSDKLHTPVRIIKGTFDKPADATDSGILPEHKNAAEQKGTDKGELEKAKADAEQGNGNMPLSERQKRAKGWYDPKTGEVVVVLDNNSNVADVENTVVHETVWHKGLDMVFDTPEKKDAFLDFMYESSSGAIKETIDAMTERLMEKAVEERAEAALATSQAGSPTGASGILPEHKNANADAGEPTVGGGEAMGVREAYREVAEREVEKERERYRREAAEEFGAEVAGKLREKGLEALSKEELSWWSKIKNYFMKAFTKLLNGLKVKASPLKFTERQWGKIASEFYNAAKRGWDFKGTVFEEAEDVAMRRKTGYDKMMEVAGEVELAKATADKIEDLFDAAVNGDLKGKPVEVGLLTEAGKEYLEKLSGKRMKDSISFMLNPSDLVHIHKRHFGKNEKNGKNIPLTKKDIRNIAEIISNPDRVIYAKEKEGLKRDMFFFLKEADQGSYRLLEVYADRHGNLTAKSFLKSKEGVSQRAMDLFEDPALLTSVTDGATLFGDAKLPKFFEYPKELDAEINDAIRYRDPDLSLDEMITKMKVEAAQANADNLQGKLEAMRAIGGNLSKLRQAMARQREYDITTVKSVTDLAKVLMEKGLLDDLSKFETKRILSAVGNVVGRQDVSEYVQKVMDIMVDNQLRVGANALGRMLSVKGSKVNARGIEVQDVLDSDGGRADGKIRFSFSENRDEFDRRREEAVAAKGLVMPGLSEKEVEVVKVPRHDFEGTGKEALQAAERWAKENLVGSHSLTDSEGNKVNYNISKDVIEKFVSHSATKKSDNIGVHLSVLKNLPKIISESIEVELHPDYKKISGIRKPENGNNSDMLIHRFYGAVEIDGKDYRVKTSLLERKDDKKLPHSYEVTKIELLKEDSSNSDGASEQKDLKLRTANLGNNSEVRKITGKELQGIARM